MLKPNNDRYRLFVIGGTIALAFAAVLVGLQGKWAGSALLGMLFLLSLFVIRHSRRLPDRFASILIAAALLNALGYATGLFSNTAWYDDFAHFYTAFAVTLALGFSVYEKLLPHFGTHRLLYVLTVTCLGITVGVGWEFAEWFLQALTGHNLLRSVHDTIADLFFDSAGAFLAALLNVRALERKAGASSHFT